MKDITAMIAARDEAVKTIGKFESEGAYRRGSVRLLAGKCYIERPDPILLKIARQFKKNVPNNKTRSRNAATSRTKFGLSLCCELSNNRISG